ncbi:MAG: hypothetical protein ACLP1X_18940 [Polyangiaceae bacterium]
MANEASPKRNVPPPRLAGGDENGRPTIRPSFDMDAFARKATGSGADPRPPERATERPPPPPQLPREFDLGERAPPPNTGVVPRPRSLSPTSIEGALLGAIEGAAPVITGRAIDDPFAEMHMLFSAADYAGALELADLILTDDPGNEDAMECRRKCQALIG